MGENMKKFIRVLIILVVLLGLGLCGVVFALTPSEKISEQEKLRYDTEDINAVESLSDSLIGKTKYKDGRFLGEVDINNSLFRGIVKSYAKANNDDDILNSSFNLENNKLKIKYPYELGLGIDTEVTVISRIENSGNSIKIYVDEAYIGKIPLPKSVVKKVLADAVKNNDRLNASENSIYFDGLDKEKIDIKDVRVVGSELKINYEVPFTISNVLDMIRR